MKTAQIVLKHTKSNTSDRNSHGTWSAIKRRSQESLVDRNPIDVPQVLSITKQHTSVIKDLVILFVIKKRLKENCVN